MCGITGIIDLRERRPIDRAVLHRMNESQHHRGPDEGGLHVSAGVGLGHRRLSIIDLATGQQPLFNEDGSVVVVFNGEIYNYQSLIPELEALGHVFHTRSDTEVIVHGWEAWGERCVDRFRGMFAFALWDENQQTLFMARDRLGVKPMYYAYLPDGHLLFGSELKSLLAHGGLPQRIDPLAVEEYFALGYVPEPRTIYAAAVKLPPGSTLTVIDVPGKRVARTISLGEYRRPHGIVMMPGDSLVAVTVEANKAVLLVRLATGEITRVVSTGQNGSHMVGVTADGTRGWTGDIGSNTASELDLVSGRSLRTIAVPAQPEAINVTPDGKEVWVGSNATGLVSVVDAASGTVRTAAEGFGWPYRVLYSPDTQLVLLPDLRKEELRFVERASRKELARLSLPGKGPQGITFAPNGRYAFLSFSTGSAVAIIDVAARRVVGELKAGETPDGVVYTTTVVR